MVGSQELTSDDVPNWRVSWSFPEFLICKKGLPGVIFVPCLRYVGEWESNSMHGWGRRLGGIFGVSEDRDSLHKVAVFYSFLGKPWNHTMVLNFLRIVSHPVFLCFLAICFQTFSDQQPTHGWFWARFDWPDGKVYEGHYHQDMKATFAAHKKCFVWIPVWIA